MLLVSSAVVTSNPLCFGDCTGSATASAVGGTAPYTYAWNTSPVQTNALATGLCASTYIV
ncbi:MAG: SprB repeat-containing protein [Flavobacteriales bacterium]|nr:SprB repeat-containing protein [Flavobacteriales bacterium]